MSASQIDFKLQTMLFDNDTVADALSPERIGTEPLLLQSSWAGVNDPLFDAEFLAEQLGEGFGTLVHGQSKRLDRDQVSVSISDQPRDSIPFGMNDSIRIRHSIQAEHPSQVDSLTNLGSPPIGIGWGRFPRQDPDRCFRAGIDQSVSPDAFSFETDRHQVAMLGRLRNLCEPAAEEGCRPGRALGGYRGQWSRVGQGTLGGEFRRQRKLRRGP